MEHELRFGLDLGRLALLKKIIWANYGQLLKSVFSNFRGQKKLKTLYVSNRDTSPLDLSLMTLAVPFVYIFISLSTVAEFRAKQSTDS